jgi:hypothetical protein
VSISLRSPSSFRLFDCFSRDYELPRLPDTPFCSIFAESIPFTMSRSYLKPWSGRRDSKSVYNDYCSSLLAISRYFSMRHGGESHFSSRLFLQNLGESRKRVTKSAHQTSRGNHNAAALGALPITAVDLGSGGDVLTNTAFPETTKHQFLGIRLLEDAPVSGLRSVPSLVCRAG